MSSTIARLMRTTRKHVLMVAASIVSFRLIWALINYKLLARARRPFLFLGGTLPYLYHSHNNYGITERSVEIPIVQHYLAEREWSRVLEIGNVTAYYEDAFVGRFPNRVVVDKMERDWKVITSDIADFTDPDGFDFVFSVSTFEHMDSDRGANLDYRPGMARSVSVACDNIRYVYENLLRPGGLFVVTAPMGYTNEWDATVFSEDLSGSGFSTLRKHLVTRTGELDWTTHADAVPHRVYVYGKPLPSANDVVVLEIRKGA